MSKNKLMLLIVLSIAGMSLLGFTSAWGDGGDQAGDVVGTYILTVTAEGTPPFTELLTLHKGGAISETNTTLHPNSANPFFAFNGSDGYGAWERGRENTVVFKFVKMVFDGVTNDHVGYLVVEATARIDGDEFTNLESDVNILLEPALSNPFSVIPLGSTDAVGRRITVG